MLAIRDRRTALKRGGAVLDRMGENQLHEGRYGLDWIGIGWLVG
jgi:hypothetical protein